MIYRCFKNGSLTLFFFVLSFTYPLEIFSEKKKSTYSVAQTPQSPKPSTESKKTNQSQTSEARFVDYFAQERLLQGHKGSVNDASFSPDGKYIVTAGSDGDTRLWNISGVETRYIASLKGHRGNVKTANFSPDGKLIVTSSFDGTVRVWNLLGNELAVLKGHRGNIYSANFSPDGKRIVTAGADKTVRVWDVSGQQLTEITGHSGSVYSANFSPDGKRIVTASADKTARLWNLSGKLLAELQGHSDTVWSANFSPDGKRIVTASDDKTAQIWDVSGKLLAVLSGHNDSVYSADFSTDGKQIVTASLDFTGLIWDASGKLIGKLEQHTGGVNSAGFSRDGKWIVTASNDGTVGVWDVNTSIFTGLYSNQQEVNNKSNPNIYNQKFSPDGKFLVTSSEAGTRLWDLSRQEMVELAIDNTKNISFTSDSKLILTQFYSGVYVWNTNGKLVTKIDRIFPKFNTYNSPSFSTDGKLIINASSENAKIWDISGNLIAELEGSQDKEVKAASFSPDGKMILTVSKDGKAKLWNIAGKMLVEIKGVLPKIGSISFSPDSKQILIASSDLQYYKYKDSVKIWDTNGNLIKEFTGEIKGSLNPDNKLVLVREIEGSFSPDGKLVTITSAGKTQLWDRNGQLLTKLEGVAPTFSVDGKQIVTIDTQGTIRLWENYGKLLGQFRVTLNGLGTTSFNPKVYFSPNGKHIISSSNKIAGMWNLSEKLLAQSSSSTNTSKIKPSSNSPLPKIQPFKPQPKFLGNDIKNAQFNSGSNLILTTGDKTAGIWDLSGKQLVEFNQITSAEFSPDGKQVLTAHDDGTVKFWDTRGNLLSTLQISDSEIYSANFNPNGKSIIVSYYKNVAVLDLNGKPITVLPIENGLLKGNASFSIDGKRILTENDEGTYQMWDISGKLLTTVEQPQKDLTNKIVFSPDGKLVATAFISDKIIRIKDISGKLVTQLDRYEGIKKSISFSRDSKRILVSYDGIARLWETNGKLITEIKVDNEPIENARFSYDDKRIIATGGLSKITRIWNLSGEQIASIEGDKAISSIREFSPDGKLMVVVSDDTARLWDLSGKMLAELKKYQPHVISANFNPDGKSIITASGNNAYLWDTNGKLLVEFKGHQESITSVGFSPDGRQVITTSWDNTARIWDLSGKVVAVLQAHQLGLSKAIYSPNGKLIVTVGSREISDKIVFLWDSTGKLIAQLKGHESGTNFASFSPDSKTILTASSDSTVRLWDISGKQLAILKDAANVDNSYQNQVYSANFSPDGKLIITSSPDSNVRIWDTSGKLVKKLKAEESEVRTAGFSPDGKLIIATSSDFEDSYVNVWDTSGKLIVNQKFPKIKITAAKFSSNGKHIITASSDGIARLWTTSGNLIAELKGHQGSILDANFSTDGQRIVTASQDGTARIWNTKGKFLSTLSLSTSSSPKIEADKLRNLQFYAPNCELAFKPWEKALKIYQDISDTKNQAIIHQKLGNAYYCISEYTNAIKSYNQASSIAQKYNYPQIQVKNILNLGNVYNTLADYQTAINKYNEALKLIPQENSQVKAEILQGKGNVYYSQGKYSEAIQNYSQALDIDKSNNNTVGVAENKVKLADIYLKSGDINKAIQFYKEASTNQSIEALAGLGNTYFFLGDVTKAINFYQQSLEKARQIEDKEAEANALNNLANALRKRNKDKLPEAEKYLLDAIKIWENLRVNLEDANKISIFEKQTRTYRLLQEILIAQNKIEEALEISERGRARAFVELLSKRLSPDKNEESQIALPNINQIQKIAKAQNSTVVQYSIITDEFKVNGKPQTRESLLYIWVVKPTGEISFRQTDLKPLWQNENTNLSELIKNTRLSIGAVDIRSRQAGGIIASGNNLNKEKQTKSLQRLHQLLINPIADLLPQNPSARVSFIPQGSLFLVPFPALQNKNGQYLIEKHTILTSPSIQVLDLTRKQKQKNGLTNLNSSNALVVGNPEMPSISLQPGEPAKKLPNLPGAETEAKVIAPMLNTKAITGSAATEAEIVQKMPKAQIIHLATHGLFDDLRGLGSALAFNTSPKDDGLLTAEEILDIKLNADLVVLSACDTGRGRITGDGVIGLSRSFISAGVPSIVVSLWSVDDDSTAFLMTEFYQNLQQGIDKGTALRKAMLSAKEKYQNPLQWAAFTLIGEAE